MRIFQWLAIAGMTVFFPVSALALDLGSGDLSTAGTNAGIATSGTEGSLTALVGTIISVVLNILGVLLFIYFVYAGILWMTAQGNDKKVGEAKTIMSNTFIGLLITLFAHAVVYFVALNVPGGELIWGDTANVIDQAGFADVSSWSLPEKIGTFLGVILNLLGVALLLLFLYAGFLWMTAQGDDKKVGQAKMIMKNAVIGLVIVLFSRLLAEFVVDQLTGTNGIVFLREDYPIHTVYCG